MSSATATTTAPGSPDVAEAPVPFARLVKVELRKMFDTRAGFWLMASIAIIALLTCAGVILFADDSVLSFGTFSAAIGTPMAIILPVIGVLAVTSEYSQRTALTTYALVPNRGRVLAAKLVSVVLVGLVAMLVATGIGALSNVVGAAINGIDAVWNFSLAAFARVILASVLSMLIGFMLGVLLRSSPAAIVAYFVYSFVLPTVFGLLATFQEWFADVQPWVDVNFAITRLYDGSMGAEQWAQLGVTRLIWLWIPLAIGSWLVMRSEIK